MVVEHHTRMKWDTSVQREYATEGGIKVIYRKVRTAKRCIHDESNMLFRTISCHCKYTFTSEESSLPKDRMNPAPHRLQLIDHRLTHADAVLERIEPCERLLRAPTLRLQLGLCRRPLQAARLQGSLELVAHIDFERDEMVQICDRVGDAPCVQRSFGHLRWHGTRLWLVSRVGCLVLRPLD
jgi:hypothetical protein